MKERICKVLVFLSWTTAPLTASPAASVTAPCTVRMVASSFFLSAHAIEVDRSSAQTAAHASLRNTPRLAQQPAPCTPIATKSLSAVVRTLFPVLLGFFFLFVLIEKYLVFVLLDFVGGFQLQRIGGDHLQNRAALIATDGIALIYLFCVHINRAVAYRACHHKRKSSRIPTFNESPQRLQLYFTAIAQPCRS